MDVTGGESKVQCCKEQHCVGAWRVRSTNQGKLEVVKQERARANVNILGVSELRWTGMGECNSAEHYLYYCGQESLRRGGVAIIVNKSPKRSARVPSQKRMRMSPVRFQYSHSTPQSRKSVPQTHAEEAEAASTF